MTLSLASPSTQASQHSLADLLFSIFVYVADADRDISPQDVQRFQSLIKDRRWSHSPELSEAAAELATDYTARWTAYAESQEERDIDMLSVEFESALSTLVPERKAAFRQSLLAFLQQLERGAGALAPEPESRMCAREELRSLLDHDAPVVSAGPAAQPASTGKDEDGPWDLLSPDAPVWGAGRTRLRCISVSPETHDTKTYSFVAEPRVMFRFKPGQFVTLEFWIDGRALRRSYTISSSPSRPYTLAITVKRVEKGWVSNWLYENMRVGAEVEVLGAAGHFSCVNHPARKLLFLSAGSGVTPMMSMLRWIADTATDTDLIFVNNVHTPQDVIFHRELLHLAGPMGASLRLAIVPASVPAGQVWNGPVGRISPELLRCLAPDVHEREVFACGPAGYLAAARQCLVAIGHPDDRFHQESFGEAPAVAVAATPAPTPARPKFASDLPHHKDSQPAAIVSLSRTGEKFPVARNQTILEAAMAQGIRLDHSCRSGICGACRMRCTKGKATMPEGGLLSAGDLTEGYVLTCIGLTSKDLTLD